MLEKLLNKFFDFKEIPDFWEKDKVYLKRWWIIGGKHDKPDARSSGIIVRVHKIMMSDSDRDLHDHPWSFLSFIMRGSYSEEMWDEETQSVKTKIRRPLSLAYRKATQLHRLTLRGDKPIWTIVISRGRERQWGFQRDGVWIVWHEYLAQQADM